MMGSAARAFSCWTRRSLSTEAVSVVEKTTEVSLFDRLSALGITDGSAAEEVNKWLEEGNSVKKWEIEKLIKWFRGHKRYAQALQLSEWLDTKEMLLSRGDHAVRIDLLEKVGGIDSAEKYFHGLPKSKRNWATYGALLNCYCKQKMLDKAEALYEKMKIQKFSLNSLVYNNLMTLYLKTEQPQKVLQLVQEMKEKGLKLDIFSYNLYINSNAALNGVEGAEAVMEEMKQDEKVTCDWSTYSNLAAIYVKAGMFEKAEAALKEVEKLGDPNNREVFHFLLSLYTGTSNIHEVNRVWNYLKNNFPKTTNLSYLIMLQSLVRLGDISGASTLFDEWESQCSNYDFRLVNQLISVYANRDMIDEAESLLERAKKKGGQPTPRTMEILMDYHIQKSQFDSAMMYLDEALSLARVMPKSVGAKYKVKLEKLQPLQKYFEENGNVDGAEDLYRMFKKNQSLEIGAYDSLLRTYLAAGKTEPSMRRRIEEDKIEVSLETEELLGKVCPL